MTTRAKFETKVATLASDFGESYARRLFGDDAVEQLPVYVRGPKKGKRKGIVKWAKCVGGGWVGQGSHADGGGAIGYVERRSGKVLAARLILEHWDQAPDVIATWELDPAQPAPLYLFH